MYCMLQYQRYRALLARNCSEAEHKEKSYHGDDLSSYHDNCTSSGSQDNLDCSGGVGRKYGNQLARQTCSHDTGGVCRYQVMAGCHGDDCQRLIDGYHGEAICQGDYGFHDDTTDTSSEGCHGDVSNWEAHPEADHCPGDTGCHGDDGCHGDTSVHEKHGNGCYYGDSRPASSRVYIPFVVVTTNQKTRINCNLSSDR